MFVVVVVLFAVFLFSVGVDGWRAVTSILWTRSGVFFVYFDCTHSRSHKNTCVFVVVVVVVLFAVFLFSVGVDGWRAVTCATVLRLFS